MEAKLPTAAPPDAIPGRPAFPYSNWGALAAVSGVLMALLAGIFLGVPAIIVDSPPEGEDLGTTANVAVQIGGALGFLLVPFVISATRGNSFRGSLRRLGVRGFRPSAFGWIFAAIGAYLVFAALYVAVFGEPEQEDIAEGFGALPVQIMLIVIAAPISEEICFRGMLFGGLRERWPMLAAAALSGLIFGSLHALTGLSAVPPLVFFGFVLALLYEKTGSILPPIILHMMNNSVALLGQ
jgi:membrane protease YdiL (CAAX protease family)